MNFGERIGSIITGIIAVAIVAVVVSNGANTVGVVRSFFGGLAALIGVAVSPITGSGAAQSAVNSLGGQLSGGLVSSAGSGLGNSNGAVTLGNPLGAFGNLSSFGSIGNTLGSFGAVGSGSTGAIDAGAWDAGTSAIADSAWVAAA